jgi:hypothetical protein
LASAEPPNLNTELDLADLQSDSVRRSLLLALEHDIAAGAREQGASHGRPGVEKHRTIGAGAAADQDHQAYSWSTSGKVGCNPTVEVVTVHVSDADLPTAIHHLWGGYMGGFNPHAPLLVIKTNFLMCGCAGRCLFLALIHFLSNRVGHVSDV